MSNWRVTARTEHYLDALKATESIEVPAEGFATPSSSQKPHSTIIKQNNTIIQLLIKISENLENCVDTVKDIKRIITEKSAGTSSNISEKVLEDLEKSLQ